MLALTLRFPSPAAHASARPKPQTAYTRHLVPLSSSSSGKSCHIHIYSQASLHFVMHLTDAVTLREKDKSQSHSVAEGGRRGLPCPAHSIHAAAVDRTATYFLKAPLVFLSGKNYTHSENWQDDPRHATTVAPGNGHSAAMPYARPDTVGECFASGAT